MSIMNKLLARAFIRFASKIEVMANGCWRWGGSTSGGGYGAFSVGSRRIYAHRFSYEYFIGSIPSGLEIDHLCSNRLCVNPAHLEAVSRRENILRSNAPAAHRARQTHCKRGHEFTIENTYIQRNGTRHCRICHRDNERKMRMENIS